MGGGWWSKWFARKSGGGKLVGEYADPRVADEMVLAQVKKLGMDMSQPREVLHCLYVPTLEASHEAARKLRDDGYEVMECAADDAANTVGRAAEKTFGRKPPHPWVVLARKVTIVNEQTVNRTRIQLDGLARELAGTYGGWNTSAKR